MDAVSHQMKIEVDVVSQIQRKIRVELPAEAVKREFFRVYEGLSQRARVKGFRPGKAPRSVLQGLYGDEVRGQVLSRLVEHSLNEVFRERGLKVVSRPEVEANDLQEGREFTFSAVVEVKPEIEVKDYFGQGVERIKLSVDEEQVEVALRHLQDTHAHLEPVEDRDIVDHGDFVVLDFVGSIDGKPFRSGKAENYLLEVGGGKTLPQFEGAIVGLKKDGEHTISVAYPGDYFNRELAGKVAVFSVTVREIKRKILPPLDDEFAKDYGECASLGELRQKVRARMESELREIQTRDLKEQLLARLIEAHPFEVPPAMVEQQIRYLMDRHLSRLGAQGSGPSGERPSMEQMRKDLEPQALRQVRAMLLVEKIAALEKIQVSEEEVQQRIEEIVRSVKEKEVALRELYRRDDTRDDLRSQMLFERTMDFLLKQAKVREVEPAVDVQEKKS
jgi:trigger factor